MGLDGAWSWKHAKRVKGRVCVARVLTLMPWAKDQLPPGFEWPAHHELHLAIVAKDADDVILGYALSTGGAVVRADAANKKVEEKLRTEALLSLRPLGAHAGMKFGLDFRSGGGRDG